MDKLSDIAQPHYLVQRNPALWPSFFWPPGKNDHAFSLKKKPLLIQSSVITTTLFGPIGDHINRVPLYLKLYVVTMLMTKINQCLRQHYN